ncbi:MAG: insulinase family protein [Coriobacteriia bacterium]|nr:insulinase family protein [Coriobacteriia bacterium]
MELQTGMLIHGFMVEQNADVPEIDGSAHVLRHQASGARLLYMRNDDNNKAFSIGFKTPPSDDTGVFHILEHSVLCGSAKFPVKEPFVDLIKTSMQTFLNAMTFSDKTVYPVASTNETDLLNLMDVYLDAVLNPAIYQKEQIFQQEGWHLEHEDGHLSYNGVVYNEMKGALSDPGSVLHNALSQALFPQTAYRFESGGDPEAIPELTYEQFLDNHARHYRLDNSYLTLYGDLDLDRFLRFLDQEYLTPFAQLHANAGAPNPLDMQEPVTSFGGQVTMETTPENARMLLGYVVGDVRDRTRLIATDILLDAVAGSNEAPLKRMLLDADLGADVRANLDDSVLQPYVYVAVKGLHEGAAERVKPALDNAVRSIIEQGLDPELVEAALSHAEFVMRERNFGISDGVAFGIAAMTSWLHDDQMAYDYLRFEDVFAFLRTQLTTGYFEQLLEQIFLTNDHAAGVELVPVSADQAPESAAAARLARMEQEMGDEDFARIDQAVAELRQAQEQPDSPEAQAALPRLGVADIGPAPVLHPTEVRTDGPLGCLYHHVPSHGIAYTYQFYGLECVDFEDLPYVTIMKSLLGKLDTAKHTASELDTILQSKLGNLGETVEVHRRKDDREHPLPTLTVSASALESKVEHLASLSQEVLRTTKFDDVAKIRSILAQKKAGMDQTLLNNGHSIAADRVTSYHDPAGVIRQKKGGVGFYLFLKELLADFDARADQLVAKLQELQELIFRPANCVLLSYTGSEESLTRFNAALDQALTEFAPQAKDAPAPQKALVVPEPQALNEAFVIPSNVTYAAVGYDRSLVDDAAPYSGSWLLASRILSYDFLWNEVRVKGGAYGTGFTANRLGGVRYYSYRDPHLDQTIERFEQSGTWLGSLELDQNEFEGYVVSTVARMDAPVKPRSVAHTQAGWHLAGLDMQERLVTRQQIIDSTPEQVRDLAGTIVKCTVDRPRCVVGNADVIRASKMDWEIVELLGGSDE